MGERQERSYYEEDKMKERFTKMVEKRKPEEIRERKRALIWDEGGSTRGRLYGYEQVFFLKQKTAYEISA